LFERTNEPSSLKKPSMPAVEAPREESVPVAA